MPYKQQRHGQTFGGWRTKRNYLPCAGVEIPRIDLPLGKEVESYEEACKIENVIDSLHQHGKHGAALLLDIAHKRRTPYAVYQLWSAQEVKEASTLTQEDELAPAWERFVTNAVKRNGTPVSDVTRLDYREALRPLLAIKPTAKVRDLPTVLATYRVEALAKGHNQTFRAVRCASMAFARNMEADKQFSSLWREIAKVSPAPKPPSSKEESALPVWQVREYIERLKHSSYRNIAWTLAMTGMRIGEYAGAWEIRHDHVFIDGTKTKAAKRIVPLLIDITPEPFQKHDGVKVRRNNVEPDATPIDYSAFRQALHVASDGKLSPHTLRHCFMFWLSDCGIPQIAASKYMGHSVNSAETVEDRLARLYARNAQETTLEKHTELLLEYVKREWVKPKKKAAKKIERLKVA